MILDKIWFVTTAGELKHVYCEINKKCSFWYSSSVFVAIKYMWMYMWMSKDVSFKTVKFMNPESEQS